MCGSVWLSCFELFCATSKGQAGVALLCCCPQGWLSCVPFFFM